ncbi:MAG TPA: VOC family protein [Bacteroidia bacterium]|jgi:PhnB protein|nr:VOC family protein [Bacteroidia bacterium]
MATVNPYLTLDGNCEEAFNFYKAVFGGEFSRISKFGDMPPMPGHEMPEEEKNRILHVSLPISKETILMGSDSNLRMGKVAIGQNLSLAIGADSKEEAEKVFNGLAAGGKITMPIADMFWGAYFGMLEDKFGFTWMVNYDYPKK